mgnify:CR=1 FL=1
MLPIGGPGEAMTALQATHLYGRHLVLQYAEEGRIREHQPDWRQQELATMLHGLKAPTDGGDSVPTRDCVIDVIRFCPIAGIHRTASIALSASRRLAFHRSSTATPASQLCLGSAARHTP